MCGSTSDASSAAAQQQADQQAAVDNSISQINSAFAGRQQQYNDYLGALNSSYQTQLNLQQAQSSRALKFSLARGGLTGSSVAADQGAELQREMGQGTVNAEQQAQAKLASLQSADVASKQQEIALAESGANIGNANQQTATALQANLNNAQANLGSDTLGNAFGGITNTINNYNTAAQTRLGLRAAQAYTNPFSNSSTTSGGYSGSGLGA
jgi:hypothetical protein